MHARVTLTVVAGEPLGREYVFGMPAVGALGRGSDCLVRVPNDFWHINVSRHHCLLEVDPPHVQVRDLGSRNGTFLNGEKIGQRPRGEFAGADEWTGNPSFRIHDGDELRVGDTVFRVTTTGWEDDTDRLTVEGSEVGAGACA